jgi:hypothetical protein
MTNLLAVPTSRLPAVPTRSCRQCLHPALTLTLYPFSLSIIYGGGTERRGLGSARAIRPWPLRRSPSAERLGYHCAIERPTLASLLVRSRARLLWCVA